MRAQAHARFALRSAHIRFSSSKVQDAPAGVRAAGHSLLEDPACRVLLHLSSRPLPFALSVSPRSPPVVGGARRTACKAVGGVSAATTRRSSARVGDAAAAAPGAA